MYTYVYTVKYIIHVCMILYNIHKDFVVKKDRTHFTVC